jgi:hypothetical protein
MGARVQHTARYRRLCELLRGWREGAGLTQRDLAIRMKKPPSYVHKCEVADRRVDPLEFVAWCRACGVARAKGIAEVEGIG